MADKDTTPKEVEVAEEAVEKVAEDKAVKAKGDEAKVEEEAAKSENGNSKAAENGEADEKENGDEKPSEEVFEKCTIKRKSLSAEGQKDTTDGTPEKKAKLDETVEAESNGEPEVAA